MPGKFIRLSRPNSMTPIIQFITIITLNESVLSVNINCNPP
jgi:hypothetical protein